MVRPQWPENDCAGELTADSRYNLIGNSDGCEFAGSTTTFLLDIDAELGPLFGCNGGPTATHAPGATSPAREAGFPFTPGSGAADACEARDQRGVPRPQGLGTCDLGALEAGNASHFVTGFVLVDTDTDSDIQTIRNGEVLDLDVLPPSLSIRVAGSASLREALFSILTVPNPSTPRINLPSGSAVTIRQEISFRLS